MRRVLVGFALSFVLSPVAEGAGASRERDAREDPEAEVRHEKRWTDVAPAPIPRELPLLNVRGVDPAVPPVDRPALRSLLVNRRFERLTEVVEKFQAAFEADPRREDWMADAYEVLGYAHEREREVIDAWVAATPRSFAPYLARATYWEHTGFLWRGSRLARDTSSFEFESMREAFDRARQDARKALSLRPRLVEARRLLISVNVADGDRESAAKAMEEALALCPTCVHVRAQWLWALKPRWGGTLEEMEEFATRRADPGTPGHRLLRGYVDLERAHEAREGGKEAEAQASIDRACALGAWQFLVARADARGPKARDEYLADLERANAIQPGHSEILSRRATAYAQANRWQEAAQDLLVVLRSRPNSVTGNWLHPRVLRALDSLAWKEHEAGRDGTAATLYDLARALAPRDEDLARRAKVVGRGSRAAASPADAEPASGDARPELQVEVVDASGRPVSDAQIALAPGRGGWAQLERMAAGVPTHRSDAAGRLVAPAGVGPWIAMARLPGEPLAGVAAAVAVGTTGARARLTIGGALRIEGRVTDGNGRPVAGVEARAIPNTEHLEREPRSLAAAMSRADGTFAIGGVDSGPYVLFARGAGQRGPVESPTLGRQVVGGDRGVVITVRPDRMLRGRVLVAGPDGTTAAAERFKVASRAFGEREFASADGSFSVEVPNRWGKLAVAFSVEGRPPAVRTLELLETADAGDVVIGPGRIVRGRVVDPRGFPVARASVSLEAGSPIAWTASDGGFEAGLPGGACVLLIRHERWLEALREVGGDEDRVDVRLSAGARLKVLAVDGRGSPVAGADLATLASVRHPQQGCTTDATGRCEISGLEPGDFTIVSHGAHGGDPNAPVPAAVHVRVGPDEEQVGVTFPWAHVRTRLTARVLDGSGKPVPSGTRLFHGAPSFAEAMDAKGIPKLPYYFAPGSGAIENLPPGRYTAVALGAWGLPKCAITTVEVRPEDDQTVTLTLSDEACR